MRQPVHGTPGCSGGSLCQLFTEAWWHHPEVSTEVGYILCYWGQFTDRRGDFYQRNGQKFRALGTFPCLRCHDPIQAVLDRLTTHFPAAVAINECRAG